jgi:creatinine amidohydrolase/Fe(II)-dependent formamide hydrolase-like protein
MQKVVDEYDYETFFEYRMDQYSKSGVVGRGASKATAELGEKLFTMVVDALVPMVKNALNEKRPKLGSIRYRKLQQKSKSVQRKK